MSDIAIRVENLSKMYRIGTREEQPHGVVQAARNLISQPGVHATGFEAAHGFTYTYETLEHLKSALPGRRFVWILAVELHDQPCVAGG